MVGLCCWVCYVAAFVFGCFEVGELLRFLILVVDFCGLVLVQEVCNFR